MSYVYLLKRNIGDTRTCPAIIYRPWHKNSKDLFVGGDLMMTVFIFTAVLEAGSCISPAATCSSKKARGTPPATVIPEKPSRNEAAMSN